MAHGQRDYGMYAAETYVGGVSDMAELAARLGSINTFDRRGKVIDLDDCEGTVLKWDTTTIGGGAVAFDNTYPKSGSQDIKLTSGGGALDHAGVSKGFMPLSSQRLGEEFIFCLPSTDVYLELGMIYFDGAERHLAHLRFDFNGNVIAYQTGLLAYTAILPIDAVYTSAFFYFPVKLVVDFATAMFVRLMYGGVTHDLSAYPMWTTAALVTNPHVHFMIDNGRRAGAGADMYIDDIILTQDEP